MFTHRSSAWFACVAFVIYTLWISSVQSLQIPRNFPPRSQQNAHKIQPAPREVEQAPDAWMHVRPRNMTESILSPRANNVVDRWIAENPKLAATLPVAKINALKQRLNRVTNADDALLKEHTLSDSTIQERATIQRRHNVTSQMLQTAQDIVREAQEAVGAENTHIKANPRLNNYTFRNKTSSTLKTRFEQIVANATVANAAAVVAEADAAARARNGTLHRTYTLPAGFKSPPGHESGALDKRDEPFWMETVGAEYAGSYPFDPSDSGYIVWRNVKDYGAVGDGLTDDTAAINKAISNGNRCGSGCSTTSVKGAVVYFPSGTYLVSSPIVAYYNTQLIGNFNKLPIIKAAPSFTGLGVISSDIYLGGNAEWYLDTANFYRAVRNFIVDITLVTVKAPACVHWQVAQATSLENMYFWMVDDPNKAQVGVFSENGSGGFMSDLNFVTGTIGLQCGNQQFTTRAMNFIDCTTGISLLWDWGWTFKSLNIYGSQYGITIAGDTVGGSVYLLDSFVEATKIGIAMPASSSADVLKTNFLNIDNLVVIGVPTTVTKGGTAVLSAGDTTIASWVYGRVYDSNNPSGTFSSGVALANPHPMTASLAGGPNKGYFERSRPQYGNLTANGFINMKAYALGNGVHDDTAALNLVFGAAAAVNLAVYMPAGTYLVTDTVLIPPGTVIIGECWSQIMATGSKFEDMNNPHVMVQVGLSGGETGTVEIQDLLFTVQGPTAGAVLVEWNMKATSSGTAAMWDSHFRVGGALGTNLQVANCPRLTGAVNPKCIASSLMLHLTSASSAYLENVWAWTADHDMDDQGLAQVDIYSARGILIESQGPCWLYGTAAEHSVLYQYQLYNAQDIFMGMIQTESPYYPPAPQAPAPFASAVGQFESDPDIAGDCAGQAVGCFVSWALSIVGSTNIQLGGAGLYSWFSGYNEACVDTQNCQQSLVSTAYNTDLYMLNLYTIGATQMVVPQNGSMEIAPAADNTNFVAHPYVSVISAWTDLDSDNDDLELCQFDDARPECNTSSPPSCDLTLHFDSLDALQRASSGIADYCLDLYTLQVVSDMLNSALTNFTSVNDDYDEKFGYYVKYIKELVPAQLEEFMNSENGTGNKYFDCTWNEQGINRTTRQCPFDSFSLDGSFYTIYYTLKDSDGFYNALSTTYGIDPDWIQLGEHIDQVTCANPKDCTPYKHTFEGYPIAASTINVPNPKDIITAALPNIGKLQTNILATRLDILLGQWGGAYDDVVQVVATPIFMIEQAVESMQQVKDIGTDEEDSERKNLILEIISIVLIFIPFVGEAAEEVAGLAQLGRMIALIGNTALSIQDIISDPSSAPMAILGILMGATDFRNPKSFAEMASARRGMSADDIAKVGTVFKGNEDKLQAIVKACTV